MLKSKNSKRQGNIGIGAAISWFTIQGHTVSIPLTDSQDYDLVIDIDHKLKKIQVKTTRFKSRKHYQVNLRVFGGNRSGKQKIKRLNKNTSDLVFVLTESADMYLIPTKHIYQLGSLTLNDTYKKWKLN